MLRRNISTDSKEHFSCNLGFSAELSKKLKWNDAVTRQAVRDIGMSFGNKPTEFKQSISSSFFHEI